MASNTLPSGTTITSTSDLNIGDAFKVFDNDDFTLWSASTKTNEYVGYHFTKPVKVVKVGIQFKYNNATLIVITEGKTWEAAEAYAQSLGGHLAMIKTSDMQNFVYNTILANSTVSKLASFWIGATDKAKEGKWNDLNGSQSYPFAVQIGTS